MTSTQATQPTVPHRKADPPRRRSTDGAEHIVSRVLGAYPAYKRGPLALAVLTWTDGICATFPSGSEPSTWRRGPRRICSLRAVRRCEVTLASGPHNTITVRRASRWCTASLRADEKIFCATSQCGGPLCVRGREHVLAHLDALQPLREQSWLPRLSVGEPVIGGDEPTRLRPHGLPSPAMRLLGQFHTVPPCAMLTVVPTLGTDQDAQAALLPCRLIRDVRA